MPPEHNYQLSEIASSLLIPLQIRVRESTRSDAILSDEWAMRIVDKLNLDETGFKQAEVDQEVQVSILLRNRQFDLITREFLSRHPDARVVHLGCGLDTRFERIDNQGVEWYDLDLPEVIQLRRELIGGESCRYHFIACSALDHTWMDALIADPSSSLLFIAEGLFMFFEEQQARQLVLTLKDRFKAFELAFDAFSPFFVWANNRRVKRTNIGAKAYWGLKDPHELERWGDGIKLLAAWYPFLIEEPRLRHTRWVKFLPFLAKASGVFHYRFE